MRRVRRLPTRFEGIHPSALAGSPLGASTRALAGSPLGAPTWGGLPSQTTSNSS